jgi:signal transduction histidine kinase
MRQPGGLVVLQLNLSFIQQEWLPALATRYFHRGGELDFEVVVFRQGDPDAVVFQTDPESRFRTGDAATGIFAPVPFGELRYLWVETGLGSEGFRRRPDSRPGAPPPGRPPTNFDDGSRNETGLWQLVVRHRAGSLEAAVSAVRLRNLAISLGILALLAVSMVLILVSTQRAQQLARQQMEFVAGVSHELQTPLAVIRSAGQNLADGVIGDSGQVKEYGSLVEKEGRRLSTMVDQVLEFAGLQSRGRSLQKVPMGSTEIEETIETALTDCEPAISEGGIHVEKSIERNLPPIMAEPSALRRAIQNLIDNAVKYGGSGKWIGIRARRSKSAIDVAVEDRGPGIAPADLPHVFEPFYRGGRGGPGTNAQSGLAKETRGNGLGLSLVKQIVESHGGRVNVRSSVDGGTVFTIHLPAD